MGLSQTISIVRKLTPDEKRRLLEKRATDPSAYLMSEDDWVYQIESKPSSLLVAHFVDTLALPTYHTRYEDIARDLGIDTSETGDFYPLPSARYAGPWAPIQFTFHRLRENGSIDYSDATAVKADIDERELDEKYRDVEDDLYYVFAERDVIERRRDYDMHRIICGDATDDVYCMPLSPETVYALMRADPDLRPPMTLPDTERLCYSAWF